MYKSSMKSPIGLIHMASTEKGICMISFVQQEESFERSLIKLAQGEDVDCIDNKHITEAKKQLTEYFEGKLKKFTVPLDAIGTEFQKKVWSALCAIPFGTLNTYADIAEKVGGKSFSRAVGTANKHNPIPIIIPCHRVIREGRQISNYSGGLHIQRKLFEIENIEFGDIRYLPRKNGGE